MHSCAKSFQAKDYVLDYIYIPISSLRDCCFSIFCTEATSLRNVQSRWVAVVFRAVQQLPVKKPQLLRCQSFLRCRWADLQVGGDLARQKFEYWNSRVFSSRQDKHVIQKDCRHGSHLHFCSFVLKHFHCSHHFNSIYIWFYLQHSFWEREALILFSCRSAFAYLAYPRLSRCHVPCFACFELFRRTAGHPAFEMKMRSFCLQTCLIICYCNSNHCLLDCLALFRGVRSDRVNSLDVLWFGCILRLLSKRCLGKLSCATYLLTKWWTTGKTKNMEKSKSSIQQSLSKTMIFTSSHTSSAPGDLAG